MKNYLPRLKQFFSNKKVIIVLLILAVSTVIFEVKQIFFTKHQPKVVYYTPWVPGHRSNPPENIPTPTIIENTDEFSVVEKDGEYVVSNPYDAYFDKSGNIFYVTRTTKTEDFDDYINSDGYKHTLYKYNLDTKNINQIKSGDIYSFNIHDDGLVVENDTILSKIDSGNVNLIENMINCKDCYGLYSRTKNLIISRENQKILIVEVGEGIHSFNYFYKKNNNNYIQFLRTEDGIGNDATSGFSYFGYFSQGNSLILGKIESEPPGNEDPVIFYSSIVLKDVDTLVEKEIYNFNTKVGINYSHFFRYNSENYLSLVVQNKRLIIINLNNSEKIIEKSFENDEIEMLFIQRNIDDKVMLNVVTKEYNRPKNNYKCFNLATKDYVSLDACGDPEKIYLGNWKGKSIYQINYQYQ
jgi:hypothetical protein